jgi:hypothetical protein
MHWQFDKSNFRGVGCFRIGLAFFGCLNGVDYVLR